MFGEFIKEKRLEQGMSLRKFCKLLEEDPSNWSKIERGILNPPQSRQKLENIARILRIEPDSREWDKLIDFANVDSGSIPEYIMSDKEIMQSLPAFFRTVGSVKPTKEEINELIEKLKNGKNG